MNSATVRQKFLDYFARQGHQIVASSSLVPQNDPTLYFTNAGMVQFKDVFLGQETTSYKRACSSQKCLRVSGKHNDLETVGRTPKHHTFFEMLGNFSFGDYFKKEAIAFAWEFLVNELGLDPKRMMVSVFAGDKDFGADDESYKTWQKEIGVPAARIVKLGAADNFWSMGEVGPCGPCSEIHYLPDRSLDPDEVVKAGGPAHDARWVEIWNLVFMQFNRLPSGELKPLARTGVDTGMGLERLCTIMQNVSSTYDTDLVRPILDVTAKRAGIRYGQDDAKDVSLRVIADHARATAFAMADGVFPEKGGREYVLRRIMRRAIRHGRLLGLAEGHFFDAACEEVIQRFGGVYPELSQHRELITKLVRAEEQAFNRTLSRGLDLLGQGIADTKAAQKKSIDPAFVGKMYDTYGFPIDLTQLIAEEAGLSVDEEAARQWLANAHEAQDAKVGDEAIAAIYKQLAQELPPTRFVGYEETATSGKVLAILVGGQRRDIAHAGEEAEIICDVTPFYGRSGGQVGDVGTISGPSGIVAVADTTKPGGSVYVHHGKVSSGTLRKGETVRLAIDHERRQAIRLNHSATHLLHHALRQTLGAHVTQKGSEVAPSHLRFDFSHFEAVTAEQLLRIETLVNDQIRKNVGTRTELTTLNKAREQGAMALFGEKYGSEVRLVHIGGESRELCGGTHVERTGDIGFFKITGEESLALGVRRIIAVTGAEAVTYVQKNETLLHESAHLLQTASEQLPDRLTRLMHQLKQTEADLARAKRELASGKGSDLLEQVKSINGIKVLVTRVSEGDPKVLRDAGDALRDRLGSGLIVLGGEHQGKATLMVMVSKDLVARVHAGKIVAELAPLVGGKGGGRPDMAQAGGPLLDQLDKALEHVYSLI